MMYLKITVLHLRLDLALVVTGCAVIVPVSLVQITIILLTESVVTRVEAVLEVLWLESNTAAALFKGPTKLKQTVHLFYTSK